MAIIINAKQFVPTKLSTKWALANQMRKINLGFGLKRNIIDKQKRLSQFPLFAKKSRSKDFQDFVKPSSLLQAEAPKIYSQNIPKNTIYPSKLDQSESFYLLELSTSRDFGSGLSDLNTGIMILLIDSDGNSILQRVPSVSNLGQFGEEVGDDFDQIVHFERGLVDIVAFKGSKLGQIDAIWVGLESGSWRLDGVNLTIINSISKYEDDSKNLNFDGFEYKFDKNTISLGEGDLSIAQLKPNHETKLQGNNLETLIPSNSLNLEQNIKESKERSMREYSNLKFSLLIYDLALVLSLFTGLTLSSFEKEAYACLFGGFIGFIYLILLQRSVDGIPGPDLYKESGVQKPGNQFLVLSLVILGSGVVVKYGNWSSGFVITPSELFVGAAGFWVSKVSVLLAAFKPIKRG